LLSTASLFAWKELEVDGVRAAAEEEGVEVDGSRRKGAAACFVWTVETAGDG
jgi:hypothetical protein